MVSVVQPTRRYWGGVGVGGILGALALVIGEPILLVGAGGVFAWLLGAQVAFTHAINRFDDSLVIEQAFDRPAVAVDEPVTMTVVFEGDTQGLDVTVTARPSPGLDFDRSLVGTIEEPVVGSARSPVACTHSLRKPEFTVRDVSGLFVERYRRGPEHELTVEPREPSSVHVGEGGDAVPIAFGEHAVDATGSGLLPAELREYSAGESASRIDWKATARLATPHVREFEAESDLTTMFVVDHRGTLDVGPEGETALAYLRSGAIGYLAVAQAVGDQVGCYGVTDDGIHRLVTPSNAPRTYERLRRQLRGLEATGASKPFRPAQPLSQRAPSLDTDTEFGRTLAAFADTDRMAARNVNSLVAAVRAATAAQQGTLQVVLFTDDTDRAAVNNAVREARRGENPVFAFLAPRVCFEEDMLADLQQATKRYREFEEFRRELVGIDGVRAFELAPRDRMDSLLEAHARRNR